MVADMGADMEVDMVTNMSADNKKKWANMELADTEVDKVADMVADNKKKRHWHRLSHENSIWLVTGVR